jgi:hypothetical protein
LGRPRKIVTDIRVITPALDGGDLAVKVEEQIEIQEPMAPGAQASAPVEAVSAAPDVTDVPDTPAVTPAVTVEPAIEQIEAHEVVVPATAPKPPVAPETSRKPAGTKVGRSSDSPARPPARDLTFGNPAKAIVDEAIWNMPAGNYEAYKAVLQQGKSPAEAAGAAGGQMAMIHRKIGDHTLRLENFLSASRAKISVGEVIDKPLEQAVLEIISRPMSDSEKDAAVQQIGSLQEWAKSGAQGEINLLQANRILLAIGDRLNWGGAVEMSQECKAASRMVYASLRDAIRAAAPEAQNLHERLTNLYAAKSEIETPR